MLKEPPYNDDSPGGGDDGAGDESDYSVTAVLRAALAPVAPLIDAAFIYGPLARGIATAAGDIDVMIIGRAIAYDEVIPHFIAAARRLNRAIHPSVYCTEEWLHKLATGNRVMLAVVAQPKIFVIGTNREIPQRQR